MSVLSIVTVFTFYGDILKRPVSHPVFHIPVRVVHRWQVEWLPLPWLFLPTKFCSSCFHFCPWALQVQYYPTVHVCLDHTAHGAITAPAVAYNWHKAVRFYLIPEKTLRSIRISYVHRITIDHVFCCANQLLLLLSFSFGNKVFLSLSYYLLQLFIVIFNFNYSALFNRFQDVWSNVSFIN